MKIVRMFKPEKSEKLKAFFDIETSEGITIKGFTLIQGEKNLFVGAPSSKGKDGKYYDNVILPKQLKEDLNKAAISEFKK